MLCRSARPPIEPCGRRCSELPPGLTVELGRKENRRVLQDGVGSSKVLVLAFELLEPSSLVRSDPGSFTQCRSEPPEYPGRFTGIGDHTLADLHHGRAQGVRELRGAVLLDAYAAHPERFVRKVPTPPALPSVAWINQPVKEVAGSLN